MFEIQCPRFNVLYDHFHYNPGMSSFGPVAPPGYHVMTKPIGPICNLDCKYCFYLEKERLYPGKSNWRMADDVLDQYIRQYIESQDVPEITFAWQGGEPTLLGVDFFRRVVAIEQKYANGKRIANAFQTNGTLLDDAWCELFRENGFLIGLSIDGPRKYHDRYRVDKQGKSTFDSVCAGMQLLKKYGIDFNTLCVVNRFNSKSPLEVYQFLANEGSGFIQFIPLVERNSAPGELAEPPLVELSISRRASAASGGESRANQTARPGAQRQSMHDSGSAQGASPVTSWSVESLAYGDFLSVIFDHWVRHDVGRVFVQLFDVQLGIWMGMPSSLCVFGETCGNAMAIEHNGDLYSCDHYVYPQYRLGNIMDTGIRQMLESPQQRKFGTDKADTLPQFCRECDVRFACNGECPKHRFMTTPSGEPGLNYLCAGYKNFFHHIDPYMKTMARLLNARRPASDIMDILAADEAAKRQATDERTAGRNDPCPCGSGRKYKKCCWDKRPAN